MNRKNNEQYKNNEQLILDIFLKLLEDEDIKDITVKQICTLANINRTTFYNHFLDIYDLLDKLALQHLKKMEHLFPKNRSKDYKDNLLLILETIKENQLLYRVSLTSSPTIYNKLKEGFKLVFKMHEYHYNSLDNQQQIIADYKIEFIVNGFLSLITYWLNNDCDISCQQVIEIYDQFYQSQDKKY